MTKSCLNSFPQFLSRLTLEIKCFFLFCFLYFDKARILASKPCGNGCSSEHVKRVVMQKNMIPKYQ
jgi:hypothetical protein